MKIPKTISYILNIGSVAASWLTPGKQAQRKRNRLDKLKAKKEYILQYEVNPRGISQLVDINKEIKEINTFFKNRET